MSTRERLAATVSTRGRVVLPSVIRRKLGWEAGTRLLVEEASGGVVLKPARAFAETRPEEVSGCLASSGPARSPEEMEAGVLAEAKRRHAGGGK